MDKEVNVCASSKAEDELIINEHRTSWLPDLYVKQMGVDFTIVIGDKVIHGHRIILSAAIPYFTAMFSTGLREKESGQVVLKDIEPEATEMIISYVYTGKLKINGDNWQALLIAADFLQLQQIMDHCCDYMEKNLNLDTIFQIKPLTSLITFSKLIKVVDDFINDNFEGISKRSEFLDLPSDELMNILSRNELKNRSELNTFKSLMNWVKHDLHARKANLAQLFKEIRLHLISKEDLIKFISRERLITGDEKCNEYLYAALSYHILPGERNGSRELWFRTRSKSNIPYTRNSGKEALYIIGGENKTHGRSVIEKLELEPFSSELLDLPEQITFHCTALLNHKLYMIGGCGEEGITNKVWVLDLRTRSYSRATPMNVAREKAGAAVIRDRIYVLGGDDKYGRSLDSVECFSPTENKWIMKKPMSTGRPGLSVVVLDGKIYAIGGLGKRSVERYDPIEDIWSEIAPMLIDRVHFGAAVYDDEIYVSGGGFSDKVQVYNPDRGTWVSGPSMIHKRNHHNLVNYQSKLYAIGGMFLDRHMNTIEELEPVPGMNSFRWTELKHKISLFFGESIQVIKF